MAFERLMAEAAVKKDTKSEKRKSKSKHNHSRSSEKEKEDAQRKNSADGPTVTA